MTNRQRLCAPLLLALFFLFAAPAFAQSLKLLELVRRPAISKETSDTVARIVSRDTVTGYKLFNINIKGLKNETAYIDLPDGSALILKRQFLQMNPTYAGYSAQNVEKGVYLTLTVSEGPNIAGTLRLPREVYAISQLQSDGLCILFSEDLSRMQPDMSPRPPPKVPYAAYERERKYQEEQLKKK